MKTANIIFVCGLFACADPASLTVRVDVEESAIKTVIIQGAKDSVDFISCTMHSDGRQEGNCPFENTTRNWTGEENFKFILYGDASTKARLSARGIFEDGTTASSTTVDIELPSSAGIQAELKIALRARTAVTRACSRSIASLQSATANSQIAFRRRENGEKDIVVSTQDSLLSLKMTAADDATCRLEAIASSSCNNASSFAVEEFFIRQERPGDEVSAICNARAAANALFQIFDLRGVQGSMLSSLDLGIVSAVSMGVANLELGNPERKELALGVQNASRAELKLIKWQNDLPRFETIPVGLAGGIANAAPVVYSDQIQESVMFLGSRPGYVFYDSVSARTSEALSRINTSWLTSASGFTDADGDRAFVAAVLDGTQQGFLSAKVGRSDSFVFTPFPPNVLPRSMDLSRHIAIGDVFGDGKAKAVLGGNGRIFVIALDTQSIEREFRTLTESGNYDIRLVDIDGRPGTEILVMPLSGQTQNVYALDQEGRLLSGWPISAPGILRDFAVTDLDEDGIAEIVVCSGTQLHVFSLGPKSWNEMSAGWSERRRDSRQTNFFH